MLGVKLVLCCLLAVALAGPPVFHSREEIEELKNVLQKSMEDDGLNLEDRMAANPDSNVWENSGKYEGDMLLDEEQIEDMVNSYATGGRMGSTRANSRWPQNTVVYEFGANEHTAAQQRHILANMQWIETHTCIRFRQRTSSDRNWIRITGRATGCYAHVGFMASRQIGTYNVARANPGQGCLNSVVIIHEFYHTLGFFHMQSTHDRYTYVRIHWENIQEGRAHNFNRYPANQVSNHQAPYEYGSCMHYGTHFFSRNRQPTLSTTRPYNGVLGQTVRITGWDVLRMRRHYNCPGAWSATALEDARLTAYEANDKGEFMMVENPHPMSEDVLKEFVDDQE